MKITDASKEALDQVSALVVVPVYKTDDLAIPQLRYHCPGAETFNMGHDGGGIVCFVRSNASNLTIGLSCRFVNQCLSLSGVVLLAPGQYERRQIPKTLYSRVNLRGESAAGPPQCLWSVFFVPHWHAGEP